MAGEDGDMAINGTPHVLIIAGSDSSGGAGIVRDIETVSAFGLKSCVAITAVTAQTHHAVRSVTAMDANRVAEQIKTALASNDVKAIKIGMLANAEIASKVADLLAEHPAIPVVLDPVLISSSGTQLLSDAGTDILVKRIMPASTVITPNLPEIASLTQMQTSEHALLEKACTKLLTMGAHAVLAKGGHGQGDEAKDWLFREKYPAKAFTGKRFPGTLRGTGCTLSSAIAAAMADGSGLETAILAAKDHVNTLFSSSL